MVGSFSIEISSMKQRCLELEKIESIIIELNDCIGIFMIIF